MESAVIHVKVQTSPDATRTKAQKSAKKDAIHMKTPSSAQLARNLDATGIEAQKSAKKRCHSSENSILRPRMKPRISAKIRCHSYENSDKSNFF